jgi:hypothetical protein
MPDPVPPTAESVPDRNALEVERLALENDKLRAELQRLPPRHWDFVQRLTPLVGGALALAGFLFGVVQYVSQQEANRAEAEQRLSRENLARTHELEAQTAARDQEFMRPLWEREVATYFRASESVGTM